jgi:hypothetical protein
MVSNVGRNAKAHVSPHEAQLEKDESLNKITKPIGQLSYK